MFGSNDNNECISPNNNSTDFTPVRIDEFVKTKHVHKIDSIIDVALGCYNTHIICSRFE